MKNKFKINRKFLIIVLSICLVVLISIIILFVFKNKGNNKKETSNYNINEKEEELPGTKVYDDKKNLSEHCLDDICVKNAILYYIDSTDSGRVEYTVVNKGKTISSGKLQMVFDNTTIAIIYDDLGPGSSINTSTQFSNKKISNVNDYELKRIK